jgi:nitronate monooxygenase
VAKAWNQTRISEALRIEYRIIQEPLGGLSSQRLTRSVSNFGRLGCFDTHGLEYSVIADLIAKIRLLTTKPSQRSTTSSTAVAGTRPVFRLPSLQPVVS